VDAALDDANLHRFLRLVDEFRDHAQLIVVTHQQATVRAADILYGVYRPEPFLRYVSRVLTRMGAVGEGIEACALQIYDEWALCHHFALYDDVTPALAALHGAGYRIGLISNTHRCLDAFQSHFALEPYITAAVSSSDHGYLKPHPSIFRAALDRVGTRAEGGVMVGDSLTHDIAGARRVGMAAVLLVRSGEAPDTDGVPVIRSLAELPDLLARAR